MEFQMAEVHRFSGSSTSAGALRQWIETGVYVERAIHTCDIRHVTLESPSGPLELSPGDYVIKTVDNEFIVSKLRVIEQRKGEVNE